MKYSPERMTIGSILSMTSPPVIVPDWQRNYSWTTVEIETFWQDLLRFDDLYPNDNIDGEEYFLGAVVIVDTNNSHLLLDGQQRIATSAILISVIRDYLARYSQDAATRVSTRYLTDYDDALEGYTYKITLNRYDRDFFKRYVLEKRDANWQEPEALFESHENIKKARGYFSNKISELYASIGDVKEAHKWSLRLLKVLTNHVSVVGVISKDEDNAASVFETLNDRGIGLSTTDLLRNLILRRANDDHMEEILDLWGEVLEIESDVKLQEFFRHFWLSREGDVKARSLYREVKSNITENEIDSLSFSRDLRASALVYQDILTGTHSDEDISTLMTSIVALGAKVLYPPILSVLESRVDNESIKKFLWYFLVAYVRHSLICKRENSLLENLMYSLAKRLRESTDDEQMFTDISEFSPNDDTFRDSFCTVSIPRRASARYLLTEIETFKRSTEELNVAAPSKVHVEHIYPQTPTADARLANHASMVNRLGNLTLLSARLNTSIKNGPYEAKKVRYKESELLITKSLEADYVGWGQEEIINRQQELATIALSIWQF